LQVQGVTSDSGDRSEALRLKGPPIETIRLEAEIDTADQLEVTEAAATQHGIFPQLAALETLVYPTSHQLPDNDRLAQAGTLEITPMETPLTLFVWSKARLLPIRLTEFSITEEAFDQALNPIRARISLQMYTDHLMRFGAVCGAGPCEKWLYISSTRHCCIIHCRLCYDRLLA
jgi:hypothetical protein